MSAYKEVKYGAVSEESFPVEAVPGLRLSVTAVQALSEAVGGHLTGTWTGPF